MPKVNHSRILHIPFLQNLFPKFAYTGKVGKQQREGTRGEANLPVQFGQFPWLTGHWLRPIDLHG